MFNFFGGLASSFARTLTSDAIHDAYEQELHAHPDEDPLTHAGHAVGRFLGLIARG